MAALENRVIVCEPGKLPRTSYMDPEDIRKYLGDYETARHGLEYIVFCKRQQDELPLNESLAGDGLRGNCVVAGVDVDGYRGLTRKEVFYLRLELERQFVEVKNGNTTNEGYLQ